MQILFIFSWLNFIVSFFAAPSTSIDNAAKPTFKLIPAPKITFNSFVDCNMAEVWIEDTFRIFPGKYGEDPLWGYSKNLKYADGKNAEEVFKNPPEKFIDPIMPLNVPIGQKGLHGP
jgi:hypothetical protein